MRYIYVFGGKGILNSIDEGQREIIWELPDFSYVEYPDFSYVEYLDFSYVEYLDHRGILSHT